jgi:uncharacterized membrane protein YhhN
MSSSDGHYEDVASSAAAPPRTASARLPRSSRTWLLLYLLAGLVNLTGHLLGSRFLFGLGLVLAMPMLIGFVVSQRKSTSRRRNRLVLLVLVALAFSWLGDATGPFFLLKVLMFLVAQTCYVVAFWPYRRTSVWSRPTMLLAYVAVLAVLVAVAARDAGALGVPVVVYGVSLTLMATLSTGLNRLTGLGGALFVLSDAILALDTFVGWFQLPDAPLWNIASYLAAQLLLVWGCCRGPVP